jgi:hypothetical protein
MTTIPYNMPSTPTRPPSRINVRLLVFLVVVSTPFLFIIGGAIRYSMYGGIIDRGSYKDVDLKALGNFPFHQSNGTLNDVPQRFRELDGQKVRLEGFMFGVDTAGNRGRKFEFVYNVSDCCFNGPPQVQERVFAYAKNGLPVYDSSVFAEIVGTLHVRIVKNPDTGEISSLYDMEVESSNAR